MTERKLARAVTPDRIQEQLRREIVMGRYRKGDKIVEIDLAEAYGASRGSVRSALQALEGEGLIRMLPNGRKEVVGFTAKEARDMYELRLMIENRAVEIAMERKTTFFAPLMEALHSIEACAARTDSGTDWYALDIQFHRALVQTSDNAALLKAWEIGMPTLYALLELNTSIDYKEQYIAEFLQKHRQLVELIVTGNDAVYGLLKEHIMDAYAISLHVMERFHL